MAGQQSGRSLLGLVRLLVVGALKAMLRLGAVLIVYALSALGGSILAAVSSSGGVGAVLVNGFLGAFLLPLALTAGFIGWLTPATVRIYARGENPDLEYASPTRLDACLLVAVTVLVSVLGARGMNVSELGFACLSLVSTTTIIATGGAKVAELWGQIVTSALDLAAGA